MPAPERQRLVVLVDQDQERLGRLASALERERLDIKLITAVGETAAFRAVGDQIPALVIADGNSCGPDLLRFFYYLRGRFPQVLLAAVVERPTPEMLQQFEIAAVSVLLHPVEMTALRPIVERATQPPQGFVGTVAEFDLIDTLQLLHMGRHSKLLRIQGDRQTGELIFFEGQLVHAQLGALAGVEAFLELVTWSGGSIQSESVPEPHPVTIQNNWVHLAMEGLRRADERRHAEQLGLPAARRGTPVPFSLREVPAFGASATPQPLQPEPGQTSRATAPQESSAPQLPAADSLADTAIEGRYRVGKLLYSSAILRRYAAETIQGNRPVWLEVLNERLCNPREESKWEAINQWASAYRSISHVALPRLLDQGELIVAGVPAYFLVFQPGKGQILTPEPGEIQPLSLVLEIFRKLTSLLKVAHANGLIHGNLHPGCIRLGFRKRDEGSGPMELELQVTGLGLLPALQDAQGRKLDEEWNFLGSPIHLAPEQLSTDAPPGPRSDIHALGVLLYQLLTGNPPYRQATLSSLVAAKLGARPPIISLPLAEPQRSQLETLITHCLAREPQDRPRSVDDVLHRLETAAEGRAIESRPSRELSRPALEYPPPVPDQPPILITDEHRRPSPDPLAPPVSSEVARARAAAFVESRLSTPYFAVRPESSRPRTSEMRAITAPPESTAPPPRRLSWVVLVIIAMFLVAIGIGTGLLLRL